MSAPKFAIRTTARADAHILRADRWWKKYRAAAPSLLADKLEAAMEQLGSAPETGVEFDAATKPGIRRLLLERSRYHVYYTSDAASGVVVVLAVWSAVRGRRPPLPGVPSPKLSDADP